jgi:hypothetical protein
MTRSTPTRYAIAAASLALAAWAGFAVFLLAQTGTSDVRWTRMAWVFASVEAVAFAAAGLLFGSTVNRQRAERAEGVAEAAERDAQAGRALAAVLKAEHGESADGPRAFGGDTATSPPDASARHARLAAALFP